MGEKKHMLPILRFLVLDLDSIKERAYLARYLVKIAAPAEMIQSDEEISEAWEEYQELIEKFKEVHSSVTEQRKQGPNTEAVRGDIKAMEEERHGIILLRIENKRSVEISRSSAILSLHLNSPVEHFVATF